jgi:hypothetical protein
LLIDSAEFQVNGNGATVQHTAISMLACQLGSYSYQSSSEARMDLWTFGVKAYAECIASTLSMNNVLPNGTYVEFDVEKYLSGEYAMGEMKETQTETEIGVS